MISTATAPNQIAAERIDQLDPSKTHVIIAANPKSGAASGLERARTIGELLESRQNLTTEFLTSHEEIQAAIEKESSSGRLRFVVAAGGDGTAGMVAQWLNEQIPLAIYPLGTENLLSKHWRVPTHVEEFVAMLEEGTCVKCDAGLANQRLFLLHATVGFDAEVVRLLHEQRTGHIRHWSYLAPLLRSIRTYQYPLLRIETANDHRSLRARWAFIFNLPAYAMGLPIVADACGTDGLLDLLTFRGGRLLNGLMYFFGVVFRRHRSWRDTHIERTTWLRIEAEDEVPYQLDGDPGGFLPLEIEVVKEKFRLIVPSTSFEIE